MKEIAKTNAAFQRRSVLDGSNPRGVLVRDKRYPWHSTLKSHTCTLLYVDSNVTVGRRNFVAHEKYKNIAFDNFSSFIIFNNEGKGKKTEGELVVARFKAMNTSFATIYVAGIIGAVVLSTLISLWFLIIVATSMRGLYALMKPTAGNFLPTLDTDDEIRISDHRISERVASMLGAHPKPAQMSALISEKFRVEDHSSDTPHVGLGNWLRTVCNLYQLDPEYDVDLIPLVNADLNEIFNRMRDDERKRLTEGLNPVDVAADSATVKRLAMERLNVLESF